MDKFCKFLLVSNISRDLPQIAIMKILILKSEITSSNFAQNMEFLLKDLFSKCDLIHKKLQIWSHLQKKLFMGNFIFMRCNKNQQSRNCNSEAQPGLRKQLRWSVLQQYVTVFNCFLVTGIDSKPSHSDPGRKEKINLNFYFHTSLWCLKRQTFMTFIKPFEALQRNVKKV